MMAGVWINFFLLAIISLLLWTPSIGAALPDVSLLVIFVTFATTFLTQQYSHAMLARLLRPPRLLAGVSSLCALFVALRVALYPQGVHGWWLGAPALVSLIPATLLTIGTWKLRTGDNGRSTIDSFTDFSDVGGQRGRDRDVRLINSARQTTSFDGMRARLRFNEPAIMVGESESSSYVRTWTEEIDCLVNERLQRAILSNQAKWSS
jgi:hypothetical protein